jgi:hypothetical protein
MAVCEDCDQEMLQARTCTVDAVILQGHRYTRGRAFPGAPDGRCGACGVTEDAYHHLGCDMEDCPRCGRQLISCGCTWADEETEDMMGVVGDTVVYPAALRGLRIPPDADEPWA